MTCVLNPTSSATSLSSMRWSPMTSAGADIPTHTTIGLPSASSSYGDSPNGNSSYHKASNGGIKKRASRAGTRSVSTLSATQLERKRANDREAQRAIRQRTKDHIDSLERQISDIRADLDARGKLLAAAHQRNRELEEENAVLRMRIDGANVPSKYTRPSDASAPPSAVSDSGSISQRSNSISHGFVMNGAWQSHYTSAQPPMLLPTSDATRNNMTGWRARESPQTLSGNTGNLAGLHPPQTIPYTTGGAEERSTWSAQYDYPQSATQHFPSSAGGQQAETQYNQQQQQQQQQPPTSAFPSQTPQAAANFHAAVVPPQQNDYQAISAFYGLPAQAQNFGSQTQYQQSAQASNGTFPPSQVPATPVSANQYHSTDHAFSQQIHPPMQLRDDADFRNSYNMAQFPPG